VGVSRDSPKFSEHSVSYRAHRAVTFAIAWLPCNKSPDAVVASVTDIDHGSATAFKLSNQPDQGQWN